MILEYFLAKNPVEISEKSDKVMFALIDYAKKVINKKSNYNAIEEKWVLFEKEKYVDDEIRKISKNIIKLHYSKSSSDKFNTFVSNNLKDMILGGVS